MSDKIIEKTGLVWLDGQFVPFGEANVSLLTHSLHYGLAAFEGIRCYKRSDGRSAVFRLAEHIDRLYDSCHIATMKVPFARDVVFAACCDTVRKNGFAEAYLRPIVFLGEGAMGVGSTDNPVRVAILAWHWGAYLGEEALRRGIRAKVSSFIRYHVNAFMSKGKIAGHYVNSILAKREAKVMGYDEAIMLDAQGQITEATGENVFIVKKGVLMTAPLSLSILPGITRDSIIRLARDLGISVLEQPFTRDALYTADEVFLTGTAAELTPVREVDDRQIGAGVPGPVTKRLQDAFFGVIRGPETRYPEWLTYLA
jgi:branched-chain amino acid aminotransferase